jgi:hypothetical protein
MSKEIKEELAKRDFLELWEMGMKYQRQGNPQWQLRYCVKLKRSVPFANLKDMECWKCPQYICNKGDCDCI